jgi:hypothetical protein
MNSRLKVRVPASMVSVALGIALLMAAPLAQAQAPSRFVGTITAISADTLTVKTDAGQVYQVQIPATAAIKQIAPGQKDLSSAETIQFGDLGVGDRALVRLDPNAPAGTAQASQIIAIKQADVVQKQEKEREDWQRRGVGGLVKSVDPASGVIVLTSGTGTMIKTITIHTAKTTTLKRYAPDSVRFDAASPAPIDAIHTGDQVRARGQKNADGTAIDAEEVVSGSFRNISGTITSLDAASSTLVVKDLITKKQVTIHITPEAQMRGLPERMAQMLAARLKGTTPSAGPGSQPQNGAGGAQQRNWGGQAGGGQGGDMQQVLSRAPAIQLADLKKGEAVMLVSTQGTTEVTAITLLAGVEPLLEAPAASQNLLANWSMDTSGGATEAAQ